MLGKLNVLKKIIIIILVFLIILLGVYFFIKKKTFNSQTNINGKTNYSTQEEIKLLKDNGVFYTISSNINKYFKYIYKQDANSVYNILDKDYIEQNSITRNNVLNIFNYTGLETLTLNEIYYINKSNISVFVVLGDIQNEELVESGEKLTKSNFSIIMKLDMDNMTYSLYPYDCNSKDDIDNKKLNDLISEVEKNTFNQYELYNVNNVQIARNYFYLYKKDMLNYIEKAYYITNEEYREKRFNGSIEKYKQYVNENIERFSNLKIDKCTVVENNNYREYVCIDNYGNYLIFRESSPMKYSVLLDSYTLLTDEFIQKYNKANEKNKAALNVQRFIEMINTKDYTAVYNILASDFKQNYSLDKKACEDLINNKFFKYNSIKSASVKEQANYYIVSVEIQDVVNSSSSKTIDFVVNLKNNLDFEISFSVD